MWGAFIHPYPCFNGDLTQSAIDFMAFLSNYIPLFYMDVIPYPCLNADDDLAKLCWQIEIRHDRLLHAPSSGILYVYLDLGTGLKTGLNIWHDLKASDVHCNDIFPLVD